MRVYDLIWVVEYSGFPELSGPVTVRLRPQNLWGLEVMEEGWDWRSYDIKQNKQPFTEFNFSSRNILTNKLKLIQIIIHLLFIANCSWGSVWQESNREVKISSQLFAQSLGSHWRSCQSQCARVWGYILASRAITSQLCPGHSLANISAEI